MMATSPTPRRKRRPPRVPQHVPPAPGPRPEFDVLDELEHEGALALALWEGLRDVGVVARAAPDVRARIFNPPAQELRAYTASIVPASPEIEAALRAFEDVARSSGSIQGPAVAAVCRGVYEWAEQRAFMQTAAHFAEAAALVHPEAPDLANLAARICRRAAMHGRAGLWYQRGGVLAVRAKNTREAFLSALGYGVLMYSLGRYDKAHEYMQRSAKRALHGKHRRMAAEAEHGMLTICSELRLYEVGVQHALYALRFYPIHHPFVPLLVHDVGYFLLSCGLYSPALPVLLEDAKVVRPQEAVLVWSSAARAAAGAGRLDMYRAARDASLQLQAQYPEHAAAALRNLAYAAQLAEDWPVAADAAHKAIVAATERRMAEVASTSRELLDAVRAHAPGTPERVPPAREVVERITLLCQVRLRKWTGKRIGRPPGETGPA